MAHGACGSKSAGHVCALSKEHLLLGGQGPEGSDRSRVPVQADLAAVGTPPPGASQSSLPPWLTSTADVGAGLRGEAGTGALSGRNSAPACAHALCGALPPRTLGLRCVSASLPQTVRPMPGKRGAAACKCV